jgi:hypothetical protein
MQRFSRPPLRIDWAMAPLALLLATTSFGCGTVDIVAPDVQTADSTSETTGNGDTAADTIAADTIAVDVIGGECFTDFDCKDIKGRTPCNLPACNSGICGLKNREAGATCKDPSVLLTVCQKAVCDESGACLAQALEIGTSCATTKAVQACEESACDADATCAVKAKADGAHCGLGSCGNKCADGACVLATAADYDDGNPCTKDFCDQGATVVHQPITDLTLPCDDGDACTKNDFCVEGKCGGTLDSCNDGKPCTIDLCEAASGCVYKADNSLCQGDNPCLQLACDLAVGCTATGVNPGENCDDGDKCTTGDVCSKDGACAGPNNSCACEKSADCDQTNLCLPRVCALNNKVCIVDTAKAIVCDNNGDGFCGKNVCAADSGQCGIVANNESKQCDDNDVCTSKSACKSGACVGDVDKACDDNNPCTNDACDALVGCIHSPGGSVCDDKNLCTDSDACQLGGCVGVKKSCDDGVACSLDDCAEATGKCVNTPKGGDCDDANPCTSDACDLDNTKGCKNTPDDAGKCDDGDECTTTGCTGGQCIVVKVNKEIAGCGCQKDTECNDNNPCTADSCSEGNCVFDAGPKKGSACATGNACHVADSGTCEGGACAGGKAKDCSGDADGCHDAACNLKTGACDKTTKADGTSCDADGDLCTVDDACSGGSCKAGNTTACPNGDSCNLSACDAKTGKCGLKPQPKGSVCEDGVYCTDNDACDSAGKCVAGPARDCKGSGDACNDGICDNVASQCTQKAKAKGVVCDDGQYCTEKDACDGEGQCSGGTDKECSNGNNACLVGVCDDAKDVCKTNPVPKDSLCNDGNQCTQKDACDGAGKCNGTNAKVCDGDACNDGVCTPTNGACSTKPKAKGVTCNDADLCTQLDTCDGAGKCSGADPVLCKSDTCNDGVCSGGNCGLKPKQGDVGCDDGNACTTNDVCGGGKCLAGTYTCPCKINADCDDANACTVDTCNLAAGKYSCSNKPALGAACSDGDACTLKDTCNNTGVCKGTDVNCDDNNVCTTESCDAKSGSCLTAVVKFGFPCNDDDNCTSPDICNGKGKCISATIQCDDGQVCTNDACDKLTGKCVYTFNISACEDGNACTLNDACSSGKCVSGKSKNCADSTKCTSDSCDIKTGNCTAKATYENYSCENGAYSICNDGKCQCRLSINSAGTTSTDRLYDVVFGPDYATVAVGQTYGGKTGYDGYLVVRDKGGNLTLNKSVTYAADNQTDQLLAVTTAASGRYLAVGSRSTANDGAEGWVAEFNASGAIYKNFLVGGGTGTEMLQDVVKYNDSTYYAAGVNYSANPGGQGYGSGWLVKIDLTKSPYVAFQKTKIGFYFKGGFPPKPIYDTYNFMGIALSGGTIFVSGYTTDGSFGSDDGLIARYDLSGNLQTQKTYGSSGSDLFRRVAVYGSYVWAAGTVVNGINGNDGWLVKANQSNLTQLYYKAHGSTGYDEFRDIVPYGSGLVAVGRTYDAKSSRYRPWMVRTDSLGNLSANYTLDTNAQNRFLYGVAYNGYIAMCGETFTGSNYDAYSLVSTYAGKTTCP